MKTHLVIVFVVGHCIGVLHVYYTIGDISQERTNDSCLIFVSPDVHVTYVQEHQGLDLHCDRPWAVAQE